MSAPDDLPTGDLDGWRCVWGDDFPTDVPLGSFPEAVSAKWGAYPYPWLDSSDNGTYHPHKVVSISGGILNKHVHTEAGKHLVAAITPRLPTAQTYGRYAVRWRTRQALGYKLAWMLWPDANPKPNREGELDFPEMNTPAPAVGGYVHPKGGGLVAWGLATTGTWEWHTDVIEWSPNLVVYARDGVEVLRVDKGIPDTPMHWVLQTETETGVGAVEPADDVSGDVQIMWAAAWAYDLTAHAPPAPRKVTIKAPARATGTVELGVDASPDVSQVKWMLDGVQIAHRAGASPFLAMWRSTSAANGQHQLHVKGKGAWWFESPARMLTVFNPLRLIAPQTATGIVTLGIEPYPWIDQAKWMINKREVGSRQAAPLTIRWDSTLLPNGTYEIFCKANSAMFGWADGPKLTITVAN